MANWVYTFGGGKAEGRAGLRDLLGGKGANLAEMASLGLPVPPGFTITTEVCATYYENDRRYPEALAAEVEDGMRHIESVVGSRFGDPEDPLLVSVRSGGRASMPGMMDTVLNLGLNDETVDGMARKSGDERFANEHGIRVPGVQLHHVGGCMNAALAHYQAVAGNQFAKISSSFQCGFEGVQVAVVYADDPCVNV